MNGYHKDSSAYIFSLSLNAQRLLSRLEAEQESSKNRTETQASDERGETGPVFVASSASEMCSGSGRSGRREGAPGRRALPKVLIVDDDRRLLRSLKHFLSRRDYKVTTVDRAAKGLAIVDELEPDLIVLDVEMPRMSGLGFLKHIAGEAGRPRYPVVVFTGREDLEDFIEDYGFTGYCSKGKGAHALAKQIAGIMKHSTKAAMN